MNLTSRFWIVVYAFCAVLIVVGCLCCTYGIRRFVFSHWKRNKNAPEHASHGFYPNTLRAPSHPTKSVPRRNGRPERCRVELQILSPPNTPYVTPEPSPIENSIEICEFEIKKSPCDVQNNEEMKLRTPSTGKGRKSDDEKSNDEKCEENSACDTPDMTEEIRKIKAKKRRNSSTVITKEYRYRNPGLLLQSATDLASAGCVLISNNPQIAPQNNDFHDVGAEIDEENPANTCYLGPLPRIDHLKLEEPSLMNESECASSYCESERSAFMKYPSTHRSSRVSHKGLDVWGSNSQRPSASESEMLSKASEQYARSKRRRSLSRNLRNSVDLSRSYDPSSRHIGSSSISRTATNMVSQSETESSGAVNREFEVPKAMASVDTTVTFTSRFVPIIRHSTDMDLLDVPPCVPVPRKRPPIIDQSITIASEDVMDMGFKSDSCGVSHVSYEYLVPYYSGEI